MFVQGKKTDTEPHEGLGVGLTMARSLAELHGGSIDVHSAGTGHGCEFTVRLPLARQPHDDAPPATALPETLAGRRLLVVDDNRDAADSLCMLLNAYGAEVRVAYGGTEALATLDTWMPHAAIVDIGMPDMDGCEVAKRLRLDPRHAGLRLIALTGWGQGADRARSHACGFDAHLTKPADIDALTAAIVPA
jgi:CheY-like chemotaxis protein